VKVLVPKTDLASGTEITDEFVANNFTEVEFPKGTVPENTARNFDREIARGYYLLKDVAANHFVPKSFLGEKPAEPKKADPDGTETSPKAVEPAETPRAAPQKKDYIEVTVNTVRGTVRHRYEKLPDGGFKYAGVAGGDAEEAKEEKKPGGESPPME
jgi:hypothetical protein